MLNWILSLPRSAKRLVSVLADLFLLSLAMIISILVTQTNPFEQMARIVPIFMLTLIPTIIVFTKLGLYRAVIRYIGQHALGAMVAGIVSNAILLQMCFSIVNIGDKGNLIFVYALISLLTSGGVRFLVRMFLNQTDNSHKQRVLIYGAGSSGRQLAFALFNGEQYHPVAFVDDDITLQHSTILGIRVGSPAQIAAIVKAKNIQRILLAMPSASRARRREVLESLDDQPIPVQTVPGMSDIVSGSMMIDELQDVKIEDLLGRDPVEPNLSLMHSNIRGLVVMVTGAGGSIGSELCRQIVKYRPACLILFELSEFSLYSIEQELQTLCKNNGFNVELKPVLGSVQNRQRAQAVMQHFKVNTVYHAAAYKHVPLVEYNVIEGVSNNVLGTWHAAEAAVAAQVDTFVLISTDKAVRPTNVMGASKRMAELALQALALRQHQTRFCMVRFGNVLGSSGSVVPLFREQIRSGGPITVTHPEIIRYFMTIPEAAQLVIQAGAMGKGGDVFVLDMGEPVRIVDLARRMVHLMGLEVRDALHPDGDIEIRFSGLRPGEKLYEELLIGENVRKTDHPRIMAAEELYLDWEHFAPLLSDLIGNIETLNIRGVIQCLLKAPVDFQHSSEICDLLSTAETYARAEKPVSEALPDNVLPLTPYKIAGPTI
ncbi:MAG: polysaccharide biosynthesis protein [Rheinheimera sp.]|nr:MAG: polysaccharide biosynthesis protein [Rheinheimera sp.]